MHRNRQGADMQRATSGYIPPQYFHSCSPPRLTDDGSKIEKDPALMLIKCQNFFLMGKIRQRG